MVTGHPPFSNASPKDPYYKCLAANRADIFWNTHLFKKPRGREFISEDLKDLIQSMLQLDPSHRPSISEILAHPWMKGEIPTNEEI